MIWLLQLAAIVVIVGLLLGFAYEVHAIARDPEETITDIARRWIAKHQWLALLLLIVIALFLIWLALHLFSVIP